MEPTVSISDVEESEPSKGRLFLKGLAIHWRLLNFFVWPPLCALIFLAGTELKWRCAYVVILMAGFWVTETLPLGITGLIPILLYPLLNILDTEATCALYFNNTNVMIFVSICLAFAIESSNLHRRIALKMILLIGTTHLRLTFGFMFVTMFVSMWIVNTAATAMMLPVVLAVLTELEQSKLLTVYFPNEEEPDEEPYPSRTTRCYFFGISYAATIGGIGSLIGTGTNYVFKGIFEKRFPDAPPIDFGDWLAGQVPIMLVSNLLVWGGLSWQYLGLWRNSGMDAEVRRQKLEDREEAKKASQLAREVVKERYDSMGPCTWAEIWVTVLFLIVLILWITREAKWMPAWAPELTPKKTKDATPGVAILILFFVVPLTPALFHCMSRDPDKRLKKPVDTILVWNFVQVKFMWGLLLLIGGGFAIAAGMDVSGLSKTIGTGLKALKVLNRWLILFIVCFVATNITEFTANVAACNILVPVVGELAVTVRINPIYLMLPATICVSYSFMLPVGTPPNALIAGYAHIRTKDMIITGILPTIFTLLVVVAISPTYGGIIYDTFEFPSWAEGNTTTP